MKTLLLAILVMALFTNTKSQPIKTDISKFNISLSKGGTYNFDKNIFTQDKPLAASLSSFSVDLTSLDVGYFITKNHEIGIGIGMNSFTEPDSFITIIGIDAVNNDTTFSYHPGHKYVSLTWMCLYYNFHFLNDYKIGIKIGVTKPVFSNFDFNTYLCYSVGRYYRITNNFLVDLSINYSNRSNNLKSFKSHQLSLSLGFNLRI